MIKYLSVRLIFFIKKLKIGAHINKYFIAATIFILYILFYLSSRLILLTKYI